MTDYCKVTGVCYWLWLAGMMTTATTLPPPSHTPPFHIKQLNSLIRCTYCHFLWRLTVGTNLNKRFPKHNVQCCSCSEWKIIITSSWTFSKHLKTLQTRGCKWKGSGFTETLYSSSFVALLWKPTSVPHLTSALFCCAMFTYYQNFFTVGDRRAVDILLIQSKVEL